MKTKHYFFRLILFTILTLHLSCSSEKNVKGAVVSAKKEASNIGVAVMLKGGNAFDAMIATGLALAVCYPNAGNISGGGFLVYRTKSGEVGTLDYREKAPEKASRDMYLDSFGDVIPHKSTRGGLTVGVPGTIAGLEAIHKKFGSLPWKELVQPAIDLARKGYIITKKDSTRLSANRKEIILVNGENTFYAHPYSVGDTVKNKALANTLEKIAEFGVKEFYKGSNAKALIKTVADTGGIITQGDLDSYKPIWRDPVVFHFKDLKIYSMGPPSSGGICLGQILKSIEPYPLADYGLFSQKTMQLVIEAERRSFADRSLYIGDPDFLSIPTKNLLDSLYIKERMQSFSFDKASLSSDLSPGVITYLQESDETTHYSIIDSYGNAVSVTTTLNGNYGSKVFLEEGGYFLNNEMDDFSKKPGIPNMFGLVGGKANAIEPKKRMLSSMTPTIIEKNNELSMILGSPGGSTIITSVAQTILNVYEFGMDVQAAVNAPRFHHQWLPDVVSFEPNLFSKELISALEQKGYNTEVHRSLVIGAVDAIYINSEGNISTAADYRGDDFAAVLLE